MAKKAADSGRFAQHASAPSYRLIVRSWGLDKTGKNHFGFTAPGPIFGQYFDPGGIEGVADKFQAGEVEGYAAKEIMSRTYRFQKATMDQAHAIEVRDEFIEDYEFALTQARTVQWDETEVWELFRWAEFGGESDAPKNYGLLNARYRSLIQAAYDAGVNLQLIQKVKEKWGAAKNGKGLAPTGEYEPTGFKEANYVVQANLEHSWNADDQFSVKVVNCRQNMTISGQEFPGLDWPTLGCLVFPKSDESDWA
jgi:hypothetical protein